MPVIITTNDPANRYKWCHLLHSLAISNETGDLTLLIILSKYTLAWCFIFANVFSVIYYVSFSLSSQSFVSLLNVFLIFFQMHCHLAVSVLSKMLIFHKLILMLPQQKKTNNRTNDSTVKRTENDLTMWNLKWMPIYQSLIEYISQAFGCRWMWNRHIFTPNAYI